ncbi:hypothetical protein AB4Y32_33235 [Paraburkholderia phymatum]|uniref:Uncharacterized protein n=1 Tax=Paraburkholderia phymatum TaxID=148447 RepID=A0ACC6UA68_9BURK
MKDGDVESPWVKVKHWRCERLSFAYFSLPLQRKVGAAPHRGNACAARRIADAGGKPKNQNRIADARGKPKNQSRTADAGSKPKNQIADARDKGKSKQRRRQRRREDHIHDP